MDNKEVARNFAYTSIQSKTTHLFIEGNSIYSYGYHFKIAEKTLPGITALFTTKKYSQTTACHKGLVKRVLLEAGYNITETDL